MRKVVVILLLGLVLLIIQETCRYYLKTSIDISPNLLIILVVFLAFHEFTVLGAFLAFLLGLEYDLGTSTGVLGPWAASFIAVFVLIGVLSQRIFSESAFSVAIASALGAGLSALAYHLVHFKVSTQLPSSPKTILLEALFTALLAPFLFSRVKGMMGLRRRSRHW